MLGEQEDLGITCALVPTATKGINIGTRHLPLNAAFQNGPNSGNNVFIPMEWVIGGEDMVGKGWRMLMESLAAGRGISLPAAAAGSAKLAVRTCGAYARVREQFGIEIGRFEGIEEVLARIGGLTYLLDSGRILLATALVAGERPAVLSAIVKQQCTDLSRQVINDAMDIHGGKGICMGPANYLARIYQQVPISITVEGANILTRSLIIFGQGSMRCHPYLLEEIKAITNEDEVQGLIDFDGILVEHIEHLATNKMRSFVYGLTRGRLARGSGDGLIRAHSRSVDHLSASLAWLSDVTLLLLGGDLKRREMLSGRFADALSNLFLVSAVLKRFRDSDQLAEEAPLADWACRYGLYHSQQALDGILRNYPGPLMGKLLRFTIFPGGRYLQLPDDALSREVAELLQTPGPVRDNITEDVFIPENSDDVINQLERAFDQMFELSPLRRRLKKSGLSSDIVGYTQWLENLVEADEISADESRLLKQTRDLVRQVIDVDSFNGSSGESAA
jgi:acyl-CoA dehydrogenase